MHEQHPHSPTRPHLQPTPLLKYPIPRHHHHVEAVRHAQWRRQGGEQRRRERASVETAPQEQESLLTIWSAQDKQVRLLSSPNPGHFSLIRAYHLADFITLMNGFCGFMSITSSMRYCIDPSNTSHIWMALGFMPFGLFFDFFDGMVARWRKKSSKMGAELDSLADLVQTTHESTPTRTS